MRALCTILLVLLPLLVLVGSLEPDVSFSWRETQQTRKAKPDADLEVEAFRRKMKEIQERFDLDDSQVEITVNRRSAPKEGKSEAHSSFEFDWKLDELKPEDLFSWKFLLLSLIGLTQIGLMMFCVDRLRRLFGLYARGVVFSVENSRYLRVFALALLLVAVSLPAFEALSRFVSSYENSNEVVVSSEVTEEMTPDGGMIFKFTETKQETDRLHYDSGFTFSEGELAFIFISVVFLVIARVMELGTALAEEQAQIV